MAIKFFNTRTGEVRVASTEPMIAAFYNSSDLSPNAMGGQDFGWKLAPAIVVEVKRIKNSPEIIREIAINYQKAPETIGDTDILKYIADRDARNVATKTETNQDYSDEYQAEIQALETPEEQLPIVEATEVDPLLEKTRKELVAMATELGIEDPDSIKGGKEKIVEAIRFVEASKS